MRNLTVWIKRTALAVPALIATVAAAPAVALPQEFSAVYSATARNMTVGQAELHLQRKGDEYQYSSRMQATGLIGLFVRDRIHELSSGRLTDGGIRPVRYDYRRSGSDDGREDMIRFASAGEEEALLRYKGDTRNADLPDAALDPLSLQIALMNDVAAGRQTMRYLVAEPKRLSAYELKVAGRERISTPQGELEAIRVDLIGRQKLESGEAFSLADAEIPPLAEDERTSFWFVPALDYLIARIRHLDPDEGAMGIDLERIETLRLPERAGGA